MEKTIYYTRTDCCRIFGRGEADFYTISRHFLKPDIPSTFPIKADLYSQENLLGIWIFFSLIIYLEMKRSKACEIYKKYIDEWDTESIYSDVVKAHKSKTEYRIPIYQENGIEVSIDLAEGIGFLLKQLNQWNIKGRKI